MFSIKLSFFKINFFKQSVITLSILFFHFTSNAAVWNHTSEWDSEWEGKYQEWSNSDSVKKDIFSNKKSPYRGVEVDCADVAYAFRAIFSFENSLPFSAKNPLGGEDYPFFTNSLDRFDSISDPHKRVVSFINFLGASMGTETLSVNDSYPIAISKLVPSDFFMYRVTSNGKLIRHTYVIKNITDNGFFDLIYSTQAKKKAGDALGLELNQELKNKPTQMHWGFKRFRRPDWIGISLSEATHGGSRDFNLEQYALAKSSANDKAFFKKVRNTIKKQAELPEAQIARLTQSLCGQVQERIPLVEQAVQFVKGRNGSCIADFTDYDTFSTPMRDGRLIEAFTSLKDGLQEIEDEGKLQEVSPEKLELARAVLSENKLDDTQKETLLQFCAIPYGGTTPDFELNTLYKNIQAGNLSSHPNDNLERRWGFPVGTKTKCKVIY